MRVVNTSRDVSVARNVIAARTLWARSKGLLGRKTLNAGEGLWLDPCSGIHTFGMAFPIDAAFLDKDCTVVHLVRNMAPLRFSRYVFKARSVLELPSGTLLETGTSVGDTLVFED